MANNTPQWAPSKPLIVSDPSKLSYFARANLVRAGLSAGVAAGTAGAAFGGLRVQGFGAVDSPSPTVGGAQPTGNAKDVLQGGQTVGDFLSRLSRGVGSFFGNEPAPPPVVVQPEAGPLGVPIGGWILGGIGVLAVGFLLIKK